jgi:hypothetical protein
MINLLSETLKDVFTTKFFIFQRFCVDALAPSSVAYTTRFAHMSEKLPHDHGAQRSSSFLLWT